ncbi:tail fiber protein [Synechococcus phage MA10]
MTLNFPTSPSVNDTYTYNGTTFVWDGEKWDASTPFLVNTANIANDAVTPDKVAVDDYTFSAVNGGPLAGMRNQIINGDFRIWQRGNGPSTTFSYTADRWAVSDTTITRSSLEGFETALVATGNRTIATSVELPLDSSGNATPGPFRSGSEWTLSFYTTATSPSASFEFNNDVLAGGAVSTVLSKTALTQTGKSIGTLVQWSITFTVSAAPNSTNKGFIPSVYLEEDSQITLVQLEPGPVATMFEHRPIGTELALCQRYYQTIVGALLQANRTSFTEQRNFQAPRTVTMRAAPTETFVDVTTNGTMSGIQVYGNSGGWGAAGVPSASNTVTALDINADAEL